MGVWVTQFAILDAELWSVLVGQNNNLLKYVTQHSMVYNRLNYEYFKGR